MDLRLRPLRLDDEQAFLAAHEEMLADGFSFGFQQPGESWADHVERIERERRGIDLGDDRVPATFLLAFVSGELVGRTSIRHELNDFLLREGGHVGYGVLAPYRRRGYATEILRQSLILCRAVGIDAVLVTCDDDNVGSAAVIERCAGELESTVVPAAGGTPKRRYWIR
jgi:predicted acetyltransferase